MNDHFLNYLQNYRNGLYAPAGVNISPSGVNASAQASQSAINSSNSQLADLIGLARIFFGNNGNGTKIDRGTSSNTSQGYDV